MDDAKGGGGGSGGCGGGNRRRLRDVFGAPPLPSPMEDDANTAYQRRLLTELNELVSDDPARRKNVSNRPTPAEQTKGLQDWLNDNRAILSKLKALERVAFDDQSLPKNLDLSDETRQLLSNRQSLIAGYEQALRQDSVDAAILDTYSRARRPRAGRHSPEGSGVRFDPAAQPLFPRDAATNLFAPTPIEHHDVLLIAPKDVHSPEEFYRFAVQKNPGKNEKLGEYTAKPELMDDHDYGQRKVLSVARPQDWGPDELRATERGPAFVTLPVKPEPGASSCAICYLVNTQNLNFRNAWTAEEWNDIPGGPDLPPAPGANKNQLEVLLAGPKGMVFRVVLPDLDLWETGKPARIVAEPDDDGSSEATQLGTVESLDLRPNMEVWHQLRNGTVMGRVLLDDASGRRVVPLVNITTLTRD